MPRLSKLPPDHPDREVRETFDAFLKERGNIPNMFRTVEHVRDVPAFLQEGVEGFADIPNMFRTVAHRPEIMKPMAAHFRAILNTGTVEKKLKELVAVRVSHLNLCDY